MIYVHAEIDKTWIAGTERLTCSWKNVFLFYFNMTVKWLCYTLRSKRFALSKKRTFVKFQYLYYHYCYQHHHHRHHNHDHHYHDRHHLNDHNEGYVVVVVDPTPPTCCQQSPAPEIMCQPAVSPPQVARKASTLSGFVQRSRLKREVGRDLHSNKWEEV